MTKAQNNRNSVFGIPQKKQLMTNVIADHIEKSQYNVLYLRDVWGDSALMKEGNSLMLVEVLYNNTKEINYNIPNENFKHVFLT